MRVTSRRRRWRRSSFHSESLTDSTVAGWPTSADPRGERSATTDGERFRFAAAVSGVLALYGFYIAFVSTKAFFTFNPFCDADCRAGVVYGMLLLLPALWGWTLGIALWRMKPWSRLLGMATFAFFALENLTRVNFSLYVQDLAANAFSYQSLFVLMGGANLAALGALSTGGAASVPTSAAESPRADARKAKAGPASPPGVSVQVAAVEGLPARGVSDAPRLRAAAGASLIAFAFTYRLFDLGFHYDLLGAYSPARLFFPRWLLQSPASSLALAWMVLAGVALVLRRPRLGSLRFWVVSAVVTAGTLTATLTIVVLRCAPQFCIDGRLNRVAITLFAISTLGFLSALGSLGASRTAGGSAVE